MSNKRRPPAPDRKGFVRIACRPETARNLKKVARSEGRTMYATLDRLVNRALSAAKRRHNHADQ
jgi:hypothetical protein